MYSWINLNQLYNEPIKFVMMYLLANQMANLPIICRQSVKKQPNKETNIQDILTDKLMDHLHA